MHEPSRFWDALAEHHAAVEDNYLDLASLRQITGDVRSSVLVVGAGQGLLVAELQGKISPDPNSRFEPPNRSRRREEADSPEVQRCPPPHVGGYERRVRGEGFQCDGVDFSSVMIRYAMRRRGLDLIQATPETQPYRDEAEIRRLFDRLAIPINELRTLATCWIVQI
ncbi:MAG: hypothetical protein KIS67_24220 [Verrucomicrobiae bacterium]|nr:hypothetical protein [Verrucomicrobiae bacterium]